MPIEVETEPRLVYASLLSELRGSLCNLKKANTVLENAIAIQREELLQLRRGIQDLKGKFESINVMIRVAGLSGVELELPDHLRLTFLTLRKLLVANAQQVSDVTGRARAVESAYLNQLVLMNVVSAEKQGRVKKFSLADQ